MKIYTGVLKLIALNVQNGGIFELKNYSPHVQFLDTNSVYKNMRLSSAEKLKQFMYEAGKIFFERERESVR